MKPKTKGDSWVYTITKSAARKKLKRLRSKAKRRAEDKEIKKQGHDE